MIDLSLSLPLEDLTRRDQYGRYLVVPPAGGRPRGYTRVTTVADTLESGRGLMAWNAGMALTGVASDIELLGDLLELVRDGGGDPWYAGDGYKARTKALVEACAVRGGSKRRAELGTFLHAVAELLDTTAPGVPPSEVVAGEHLADLEAYRAELERWNVELALEYVEAMIVLDSCGVAGRIDRLARIPWLSEDLVVLDLKTGADLRYSWLSIAVQLAAYAHAEARYLQGDATDGSADVRLELPAIDRTVGVVAHMPAGEGRCELHVVDLELGWRLFERSLEVREVRSRSVFARPMTERAPLELAVELPDDDVDPTPTPELVESNAELRGELRSWLQARIDVLGAHDAARARLPYVWPAGVAPLRRSEEHSDAELEAIEQMLDDLEAEHSIPFGPRRPGPRPTDGVTLTRLRVALGPFTNQRKDGTDAE